MDSITTLVKPIFLAGKVLGFFPFSIDSAENLKNVHLIDIFHAVFDISVWIIVFHYRFLTGLTVQKSASSLASIGVSLGALMGFFVLIGSGVVNYFNRLKFYQILENFKNFDRKVILIFLFIRKPAVEHRLSNYFHNFYVLHFPVPKKTPN